jgi:feruloyl esterase
MRTIQHFVAVFGLAAVLPSIGVAAQPPAMSVASCEALAGLALSNVQVTLARAYAADEFTLPAQGGQGGPGAAAPKLKTPAFCRVTATQKPSGDSAIRTEFWLPMSGWNGKYVGVGNGGTAGVIQYSSMVSTLQQGYALANNDTGHEGGSAEFAVDHPERMIDYAYRANHEMTLRAKEVIAKFYGKAPSRSIWVGCSLGGLQGLIEARRYAADYDGIVAGAPPNPLSLFNAEQIYGPWLNLNHPEGTIPTPKFAMIHQAALKACGTSVGLAQGFIEDPERCQFDPGALLCKNGDANDCLTAPQVQRMRELYRGPVDPRTGKVIFPGPAVGAESQFEAGGGTEPLQPPVDLYRYMVYKNRNWDWKTMDYAASVDKAVQVIDPLLRVDDNLNAFLNRGGKLMLYVGWTEGHNGNDLVNYYRALVRNVGAAKANNVRLFLVPGMNHCGGGAGCDTFEKAGVVDEWVGSGNAPDQILSSKFAGGQLIRTRPLCAWPMVARYKGAGSKDEAANFECRR